MPGIIVIKKKNQFPTQCDNYSKDKEGWGTAIEPRLKNWIELKEHYETLYEENKKAKPGKTKKTKINASKASSTSKCTSTTGQIK